MKQNKKRLVCAAAAAVMTFTAVSGTTVPASDDAPNLTYWIKMDATKISPTTDNFGTILCYKEMADITGVNVEFIHPPAGQENDSFNLMIAGGEYPDLIHWDWGNSFAGGPDKAIDEGIILDLTDLIEENCPNLTAFLDEHPEIKATMTTDNGRIYCFPNIYPYYEEDTLIIANRGYQMRSDWLKELGLEAPVTIDDWHAVLTAFKEKGESEGAEIIPMVSQKLSSKTSMIRTLANAWGGLDYDFSYRYPPTVTLTEDEAQEYAEIMSDIETFRDEKIVRFIIGSEDLEDFEDFVGTIEKMNIERAIEIKQEAYDRLQERISEME